MGVLQIKFSGLFWETSGAQQDQWTEYFFTIAKNKTRSVMKSCSQDKPIFLMKMTNIQVSSLGVAPRAYLLSSQEGISGSNSSGCQYWGWDVVTYMWLPHESRSCYHVARNKIQKSKDFSISQSSTIVSSNNKIKNIGSSILWILCSFFEHSVKEGWNSHMCSFKIERSL